MLQFWLNDVQHQVPEHIPGTTTLLRYLRDHLHLTGTKEGCAEGDCGACTVALSEIRPDGTRTWRAVNACLLFLPMLQGKRVYTVEGLRDRKRALADPTSGFHPVQQAVVDTRASQCGYCTPGVVMSLFEACYREDLSADDVRSLEEQMAGNLCRCTGYRPIREAAAQVAGQRPTDQFRQSLEAHEASSAALEWHAPGQVYLQPASLTALWAAREQYPQAVLAAGGTDLGLRVTKGHLLHPDQPNALLPAIIGLEGVDELRGIERLDNGWRVGAGATLTQIQERVGPSLPGLEKMLRFFGARQIRNRATLGGNLCNASPIGDLAPVLLALDAVAILVGPAGERSVPLAEFFTAYRRTALVPPEILLAVTFQDPPAGAFFSSYKVSKRRELDISGVSAGMQVLLYGEEVVFLRLAYGGVAATPVRARRTEQALLGQPWCEANVQAALDVLDQDFTPISDHRGSAAYRRTLARNLLLGFYLESLRPDRDRLDERPTATVRPHALDTHLDRSSK